MNIPVGPILVHVPEQCSACLEPLGKEGAVFKLESEMPGFELLGDTTRYIGWHVACAPRWALVNDDDG